jgi:glycosyltransferase involved in cell wall biosynthesis
MEILVEQPPRVTFGIPARNEAESIARCLDSILAQDFEDYEVIVSDNASTDSTREIVLDYASRDPRIRLFAHDHNIGIIENFNHVARLGRGEFFRWMGADDWIEPTYTSECVAALERAKDAIVATTNLDLARENGEFEYFEYHGERLDSPDPVRRLERLIWLIEQGPGVYEPVYAMMRRRTLMASGLLRIHRKNDWLLAVQLSLVGPFVHVDERLFHRWWPHSQERMANLSRKLHPVRHRELEVSSLRLLVSLLGIVGEADLSHSDRRACQRRVIVVCARQFRNGLVKGIHRFRRERLGLTRDRLRGHP